MPIIIKLKINNNNNLLETSIINVDLDVLIKRNRE